MKLTFCFIVVNLLAASFASAQEQTVAKPRSEKVTLYNPTADAKAEIAAAASKAKTENKHVFIMAGGNWCSWCIKFHKLVDATPDLKAFLDSHYEFVLLNVSKENENRDVMAGLSNPGRFGYPVFLILDGDGKLIHTQNSAYLEEGEGHSVKKIMEFLQGWTIDAMKPAKPQ